MNKLIDDQFRQGDVLLMAAPTPTDAVQEPADDRVVLAHGEATGHAHAIYDRTARIAVTPQKERHLQLVRPAALKHEEHTAIPLDKPNYHVIRQTEWTDENEPRVVAD